MMTNTLPQVTKALDKVEDRLPPIASHAFAFNRAVARTSLGFAERMARTVGISADRFTTQVQDSKNTVTGTVKREVRDTASTAQDSITTTLEEATDRVEATNPSTDYASMTKAELYDLAQDRDIDGRSQMSKAELAKALKS